MRRVLDFESRGVGDAEWFSFLADAVLAAHQVSVG